MNGIAYAAVSAMVLGWKVQSQVHAPWLAKEGKRGWDALEAAVFESKTNTLLLLNLAVSLFIVAACWTKHLFFGKLTHSERNKITERTVNYVLFKAILVASVVKQEMVEIAMWTAWFALLGFLKMFAVLARDRSEQLSSTPAATMAANARNAVLLFLLLALDGYWAAACFRVFHHRSPSEMCLLLFETAVVGIHSTQTLIKYGLQLAEWWKTSAMDNESSANEEGESETSVLEWKSTFQYHTDFVGDVLTLVLSVLHFCHIWLQHGISFQVVDAILLLNVQSLLRALLQKLRGYVKHNRANYNLQTLFKDVVAQDLVRFGDECAVCRETIKAGKKLPCGHVFHTCCLRSWLNIARCENYSCPTCRRSLVWEGME